MTVFFVETPSFYADMKDSFVGKNMEKKVIIDFLTNHWDEFMTLLSEMRNNTSDSVPYEKCPVQVYAFTGFLSQLLAAYSKRESAIRSKVTEQTGIPVKTLSAGSGKPNIYTADVKGLLKKAQYLRKYVLNDERLPHPIIIKNGLFTVQPQYPRAELDSEFKNLVDSVLL